MTSGLLVPHHQTAGSQLTTYRAREACFLSVEHTKLSCDTVPRRVDGVLCFQEGREEEFSLRRKTQSPVPSLPLIQLSHGPASETFRSFFPSFSSFPSLFFFPRVPIQFLAFRLLVHKTQAATAGRGSAFLLSLIYPPLLA